MSECTNKQDILELKELYKSMWTRLSVDAISRLKTDPKRYYDFAEKDLPLIKSAIAMCDGILGFMK